MWTHLSSSCQSMNLQCDVVQLLQLQRNPYIVEPVGSATGDRVTFVCSAHVLCGLLIETEPNRLQSLQEVRKVGGLLSPPDPLIPSNKRFPYWAADTMLCVCVCVRVFAYNATQRWVNCRHPTLRAPIIGGYGNNAPIRDVYGKPFLRLPRAGGQGSGRAHSRVLSEIWDSHVQ